MRVINFNAGPAGLPLPALERAREELLDFQGTGMSIMEHSHRGKDYESVHNEAIALLTELLQIPATHQVLFLQGGGHLQFAMVPMNFLKPGQSADYVLTDGWSEKAHEEAKGIGSVKIASNTKTADGKFLRTIGKSIKWSRPGPPSLATKATRFPSGDNSNSSISHGKSGVKTA